ncbi:MAG: leucyl aminopeptidase [Betaproteobacteria bacterium]|jgi:leucyl aminopeptidase|nr:leucyl aminopeptidase [Pseudomonadota bacterium]NBQ94190.1 leucyl aminopeptidase [Betaproteobacteria bacterium]NBS38501.1 leucyl aminopeptidase [Betaproteobacteria bacterium]NBT70563.1 leucyl aminopeptidase [Betaproteobacteria bacterium]NBY55146.1 leucyl aminopeptidase [Betaproteobacteria bacterium]
MQCKTIPSTRDPVRAACLIIPIDKEGKSFTPQIPLDEHARQWVLELAQRGDLPKANGSCLWVPLPSASADATAKPVSATGAGSKAAAKGSNRTSSGLPAKASQALSGPHRVLLVRLQAEDEKSETPSEKSYLEACKAVAKHLDDAGLDSAVSLLQTAAPKDKDLSWATARLILACREQSYRFDVFKRQRSQQGKDSANKGLQSLLFAVDPRKSKTVDLAISQALALANGMDLTKDLGNTPPNICTPEFLADKALALGKSHKIQVQVLERRQMQSLGMGALLAVAQGSSQAPRLIVMHYQGTKTKQAPIVLVGKGITFDTGGISIKPAGGMDEMKFDMCGAASVFGAIKAAAEMKLPLHLIGLVPAAENMPDGNATRPGDIVSTLSGQTVEILNTDAEGRLILCDALTYCERFKPDTVIDIATLTGACVVALGAVHSGLFSPDDELAEELVKAGKNSSDTCWRMPVEEAYQDGLKSNFADMANVGGREGGAITAACFLARFTKAFRWAHLDIAGTAWRGGSAKGASARPVPLLMAFLQSRAGL